MTENRHRKPCRVIAARVLMVLLAAAVCPLAFAQEEEPSAEVPVLADARPLRDPLATKQQIVRDRMAQLEDRMFRLAEKLAGSEPQQSKRLESALKQARELLIRRSMDEIRDLLEAGELTAAADAQVKLINDIEQVLKTLLEDPDNTAEREREIEQLEKFRQQVDELLDKQRELKKLSESAPRLEQMLAAIRAAIARLEKLIDQQEEVIAGTGQAGQGQSGDLRQVAEDQKKVRQGTEEVDRMLGESGMAQEPGQGTATRPGDAGSEPGESGQSGETPPGAESPSDSQKPGSPGESGDSQGQSGQSGKAGQQQARSPEDIEKGVREARNDLDRAAGEMRTAENELSEGHADDAMPLQQKAGGSLERALRQLQQQEEQAQKLLDQAEAAREQRELQQQAEKLADEMKNPGSQGQQGGQQQGGQQQGGNQQGGQQGGQQQGGQQGSQKQEPAPGSHNVEQAGDHMQDAGDDLEENSPNQASEDQEKAIDELEQARQELDMTLDQLRREQQEEILRGLESRFRAMLTQQLAINAGTEELEDKGRKLWVHADELRLAGIAEDESDVADQAARALHILEEEGTTIVFPVIVEQMREDMLEVARRLREKDTGPGTQQIEGQIVETLEELVEAIKELRRQLQTGEMMPGGGKPMDNPPLLPDSAELKLLRSCQIRVKQQTEQFDQEHPEKDDLEPASSRMLERIGDRQEEIAEMARKMNERITGQ